MKYLAFLALTSAAEFCDDTAYCCKTPADCDVAALTTEWEGEDAGASQPEGSKPHANMGCGMATFAGKDDDGNATTLDAMVCLTETMCAGGKWGDDETVEVTAGACDEADDSESDTEPEDDDETEEEEGGEEGEEGDEEDADEKALCDKWNGEDCEAEALTDEEKTECTDNQASGAKALAAGAMALIAVAAIM